MPRTRPTRRTRPLFIPPRPAALCLLAVLVLAAAPARADRLAEVLARGVLRAGVKDAVAPFGFRGEDGAIQGFEPDLVRAVAERMGVRAELTPVDSGTRIAALAGGRLDLVAATMTHTFSRDEVIDFSVTYFVDGVRLLVAKASGIRDAADLAGRKVAAINGDTASAAVAAAQPRCRVVPVDDFVRAFLALKRGEVDAVAADASILLFLKNADPEPERWSIAGRTISSQPVAMGLPQNESALRDAVNKALMGLWLDGGYKRIYARWFGDDSPYRLPLDWSMEVWPQ